IGTQQVAKSNPDGYTLVLGAISPLVISPLSNPKLQYDVFKDLTPVAQLATTPLVLVVNAQLPVKNVGELVDMLKREPGKINYATAGMGAPSHLAAEIFKRRTNTELNIVHYKGTGAFLQDLFSGQVHFTFDSPAPL